MPDQSGATTALWPTGTPGMPWIFQENVAEGRILPYTVPGGRMHFTTPGDWHHDTAPGDRQHYTVHDP